MNSNASVASTWTSEAASVAAPNGGRRAVSGSFYSPGTFPSSKGSGVPPIYVVPGGGRRPQQAIEIDVQLRAAQNSSELMGLVAQGLPRFDIGNVVVAFTCAAKTDEGREMASLDPHAAWANLKERLLDGAEFLEPRGMSMTAYAAAKLVLGDRRLLEGLATAGSRRALNFGATDVAKSCWAFAKLRYVEEVPAHGFWQAVLPAAVDKLRGARFVDISMIAWAFSTTDQGNEALFSQIAAATCESCATLPPRSVAGMAYALARAGWRDPKLYGLLVRRSVEVAADFSAHDAAALCWGLSAANAADRHLFEQLMACLEQPTAHGPNALRRLSAPLAAELAWALAAAGARVPDAWATLEKICLSSMQSLETEDVAGFAWAFATAGHKRPEVFRIIAAYAERYAGRLRPGEVRILSWALAESGTPTGSRFEAAVRQVHGG